MTTVAIIQARMGSSRLPGKVLRDLVGAPMLERVVNRVRRATSLDDVVVATSTLSSDDPIEALCAEHSWNCFRGSENDVLTRFIGAASKVNAGAIVRIT